MNIGGALGVLGSEAIGTKSWGGMIVKICNFHLPDDKLVTLTDTGDEVMGKVVAMDDKVQVTILTMDIGNLDGFDPSSSRGVNVMKAGAVIIALAMVVIGAMSTFMYSNEEGGMDVQVLNSIFSTGMELVKLLLGVQGA
jgi:hypothetical protein